MILTCNYWVMQNFWNYLSMCIIYKRNLCKRDVLWSTKKILQNYNSNSIRRDNRESRNRFQVRK